MIETLCSLGSRPILATVDISLARQALVLSQNHKSELIYMLGIKNGFYAFESALHVFPFGFDDSAGIQNLVQWNLPSTWKELFEKGTDALFCFAEDIFGYQFSSFQGRIVRFDPETGETEDLCGTVEEWASLICRDFNLQTGYQIALEWQATKGIIQPGNRLLPIYPFVSDLGTYELTNLYEIDAVKGMRSRADFARQIKLIPDGSRVRIVPKNLGK